jgi:hypothetical protein
LNDVIEKYLSQDCYNRNSIEKLIKDQYEKLSYSEEIAEDLGVNKFLK